MGESVLPASLFRLCLGAKGAAAPARAPRISVGESADGSWGKRQL